MKSFPTSLAAVAACLCAAAAAAAAAAPLDSFLPPQPTVATGGDLQPPFTVTDADACANACLANASCVSFSLDQTQQPPTKTCGIVEECYAQNASTCPSSLVLSCVGGTFTSVSFASFGLPLIEPGQCAFAATPNCSAPSSVDVLTRACVGKSWCSIDAEVATFGADPCQGTVKFLAASLVGAGCSAQPPPPAPLTCTLSGYSRIYTIEGGNSSTRAYYQRLMPRNDAPFSQAVPYLLDVPRGNVSIREGHVLRTAFDNGILYLTQHYTVDDAWKAEEVWTSRNLKPDFNDFVVFEGHAYGFDSNIFSCIDLETGQRNWKGGRYGKGQVLLQSESGLLIVMGEQGEVVLLKADPKSLTELSRFQAISGKTWNHPVLIGDRLYVRNAQEAACYQLPMASQ